MPLIPFERAERLRRLPPYLFAEIDRKKREAIARGVDIISLGVGDPDLPTAPHVIAALRRAAEDPKNHQYPSYEGVQAFREAVADWYRGRFEVDLDSEREVLSLIGSKEGIAHIPLAFLNPGDVALVPEPAYPVYQVGTLFAGGEPYSLPLRKEREFLPDLDAIPPEVARRAKILFLNYPNNPTAAVAPLDFFERVVAFARRHGLVVCHDAAYSEVAFDGYRPRSFLQVPGAKEVGVEFHSLSKTYNMTGWRIGFAVGNAEVLAGLGSIKTNVDSGVFQAVQEAGIEALRGDQGCVEAMRNTYERRRDILADGLRRLGLRLEKSRATFYLWVEVPKGHDSTSFCGLLLDKAGVVTTPGVGFGQAGEGFVRMTLTVDEERLREVLRRLERVGLPGASR
ncbi:MAG: LL-diaminopimelate aminotransferase [Nitrospinota bacterium]